MIFRLLVLVVFWQLVFLGSILAEEVTGEKLIRVYIALCDNKTQGIVPVGESIGNGDRPEANLYWGCSDGFSSYFKRSKRWKVIPEGVDFARLEGAEKGANLRGLFLRHVSGKAQIKALAYRGSNMKKCFEDYERAVQSGKYDVVVYIGHNPLMDFKAEPLPKLEGLERQTAVVVLCCKSAAYFTKRSEALGARPILMTDQFMYPGAFILHDALEPWLKGMGVEKIREAAGRAYAKNQKISVKAATGVFTKLSRE